MDKSFGEALADILEGAEKIEGQPVYVSRRREALELAKMLMHPDVGDDEILTDEEVE